MKKTRHSEEQIIGVLKQMEAGRKVSELARELEEENRRLMDRSSLLRRLSRR